MIFFDTEVFSHNWVLIAADIKTGEFTTIIDDVPRLKRFYDEHQNEIWVAYNGKNYDKYIVQGLLTGHDAYKISKHIIGGEQGFTYSDDLRTVPLYIYDPYNNLSHSLKYYEGCLGLNICESKIPFDIDRPLTDVEIRETVDYCTYDVKQLINVFFQDEPYADFLAQLGLLKMSRPQYISKTKTQLAALILKAEPCSACGEFLIDTPETLRLNKYSYVKDWYYKNHDYDSKLETVVAGVPHTFGWGGVHGSIDKYSYEGNILVMDVASLYPSLMIEYGLLSNSVRRPELYKELRDKRLEYKRAHNPLHQALKIVLNSTYGACKDKNNALYDPRQANRVCIYGQLLLLDLIEHLEPHCKLIQSNTDGIFITDYDESVIKNIVSEWQSRTRLTLEITEATKIIQKDVNNYLLVMKDGSIKSKGAYLKELTPLDYGDMPIINIALKEYLLNGTPIETTINNCNRLIDFQMVVKVTGKFDALYLGDKKLNEKCVCIFAGGDSSIFKRHTETKALHKISNSPEHCFIDNTDIHNKTAENINKQFYIDLATKRLEEMNNNDK